jgi:hypothetical protein
MRRWTRGRTIALTAAIGLIAVVLSCGGAGLALHQRVVEPAEIDLKFGPFRVVTTTSHPVICLGGPETSTNPCYRYQSVYVPETYRIWLFMSASEQGVQRSRVLLRLVVPLRQSQEG